MPISKPPRNESDPPTFRSGRSRHPYTGGSQISHRSVLIRYVVCLAAAIILLPFLLGREMTLSLIFGPAQTESIEFETLDPGARTNRYLVCPAGFCAGNPDRISKVYGETADSLKSRWMAMINSQPRIAPGRRDDKAMQYDFVQRSKFLRFPDSITVRFIPLADDKSSLAIYSRSHYGRSDFGVNRNRIERWLALLDR